ncbi:MAG: hypothetical protein ACRDUV_06015, partial [Pseudonocardiaceae bacterium]
IAWELQLSFYLPAFARSEAMLLHPSTEPLIETLARAPYVVLAGSIGSSNSRPVENCGRTSGGSGDSRASSAATVRTLLIRSAGSVLLKLASAEGKLRQAGSRCCSAAPLTRQGG